MSEKQEVEEINYYDVPAISASGINAFHKSPLHYWKESPFNPEKESKETDAMIFGRVCHTLALEPELFDEEFAVEPDGLDRRTKDGKIQYAAFVESSIGRTVIKGDSYNKAKEMGEALQRNSAVRQLLGQGSPELPIFWNCDGIECKAKLDYYRKGLIVEYKTSNSASPKDFCKSLANYGYHRQAAWYMDAIEKKYGERPKGFVFIVQEKPLPDAIGIYAIDEAALEYGKAENEKAFGEMKERLKTGNWQAFPERIVGISLPRWYSHKQ